MSRVVDKNDIICYYNEANLLHRLDGPAYEDCEIGQFCWYINSQRHREDGPAVIYRDGYQAWYRNGLRHREDGPAIITHNQREYWYNRGELHRIDGPAIEEKNSSRKEYWIHNQQYTEEEFKIVVFSLGIN